jgi:hypothetical protein
LYPSIFILNEPQYEEVLKKHIPNQRQTSRDLRKRSWSWR